MIPFWALMVMLAIVWTATTSGEERWWGLGMFAFVAVILLGGKWIGADQGEE